MKRPESVQGQFLESMGIGMKVLAALFAAPILGFVAFADFVEDGDLDLWLVLIPPTLATVCTYALGARFHHSAYLKG